MAQSKTTRLTRSLTGSNARDRMLWKRIGIGAILLGLPVLAAGLRADEVGLLNPRPPEGPVRVLRFPSDQCMGSLLLPVESEAMVHPEHVRISSDRSYLGLAQGDVTVPADQGITLAVFLRLDSREAARLRAREPESYKREMNDRYPPAVCDLSGLSSLDPNDLHTLAISQATDRPTPDEHLLEPVTHLTGLRALMLNSTGVTDKGLEPVRTLRRLQVIEFHGERNVKSQGLAVLKDLPDLQVVNLDTGATDAGLKHVAQVPNLRFPQIRMTGRIWGPGLAELAQAPRLERLCLCGDQVRLTDRQITYLEGLTQLKSLTLWGICDKLTDASLASIAKLENLEELYFIMTGARFTNAGIGYLERLRNLRKIRFPSVAVGADGLQHLVSLPRLESIKGLMPTADVAGVLPAFRNLKSLDVNWVILPIWTPVPSEVVAAMGELRSLEDLALMGGQWSQEDLLVLGNLSNLKRLRLGWYDEFSDPVLAQVARLKDLEYLDLSGGAVSKRGLNQLNGLSNLRSLSMHCARRDPAKPIPFDEGTLDLSGLRKLEGLSLSGLVLHDEDLACIEYLTGLETLKVRPRSPFPGTSLRRFAKLPKLTELVAHGLSGCTGEDLAVLNGLPDLERLFLRGQIPGAALASLDDLPRLAQLCLHTSAPTQPQTVADLRQRFNCLEFHNYLPGQQPTSPQRPVRSESNATRRDQRSSQSRRRR